MTDHTLSKRETEDIEKVLGSRKPKQRSQKKQKRNKSSKPDAVIEAEQSVQEAYQAMKKLLKPRSKTELIELIWTYGAQLQQLQHACQVLLEENKELKGESNV